MCYCQSRLESFKRYLSQKPVVHPFKVCTFCAKHCAPFVPTGARCVLVSILVLNIAVALVRLHLRSCGVVPNARLAVTRMLNNSCVSHGHCLQFAKTAAPKRALLGARPFTVAAAAPKKPANPQFAKTAAPKRALLGARPFTVAAAAPKKPANPQFAKTAAPKRALLTARPLQVSWCCGTVAGLAGDAHHS
jgi:hypothetical protein